MASRMGSSLGVAQHDDDAVATQEHLAATGRGSVGRGGSGSSGSREGAGGDSYCVACVRAYMGTLCAIARSVDV